MVSNSAFTDVPTAVEEIRAGRMIVVVDDEDRENEGDLTLAAEKITPEAINSVRERQIECRKGILGRILARASMSEQ